MRFTHRTGVRTVLELCDELDAGLDRAHQVDPTGLDDDELEAVLARGRARRAREDALEAKLLAEWDQRKLWAHHGARTPAAYIATSHRLPIESCRRPVRVARSLRPLPTVAGALAQGKIESPHVQRILGVDNARTHDALVADQERLTGWAATLPWRIFCRRLQDWLDEHDPDGPQPDGIETRRFSCSKTLADCWALDGWLDPVNGSIVARELDRLERFLFEADWKSARDRLGREPLLHELERTPPQRRADALVLMAERSATMPNDGRRGRPLFTVLVDYKSFERVCELTNGIELRPGQLAPFLDRALVERIVFDGGIRAVGVSRQRGFRGLLRKVVLAAHRRCAEAFCEAPIDECEVDHVDPWANDGPTSQENAEPRCPHHNRRKGSRPPPDATTA
jgi:hypothetical protein